MEQKDDSISKGEIEQEVPRLRDGLRNVGNEDSHFGSLLIGLLREDDRG